MEWRQLGPMNFRIDGWTLVSDGWNPSREHKQHPLRPGTKTTKLRVLPSFVVQIHMECSGSTELSKIGEWQVLSGRSTGSRLNMQHCFRFST